MDRDMIPPKNRETNINQANETTGSDTVSTQRRKLIRASAAVVPAIMTLRSGAAAAAAAASINGCIQRDAERAALELGPEDNVLGDSLDEAAHDQWVRIPGKAGRKLIVSSGNSSITSVYYCIKNEDISRGWDDIGGWNCYNDDSKSVKVDSLKNYWNDATDFYCVNKAGVWECVDGSRNLVKPTILATDIDAGKDVNLLVYVTSFEGEITGAAHYPNIALINDQAASPIGGSCLCSVDPNFNLLG